MPILVRLLLPITCLVVVLSPQAVRGETPPQPEPGKPGPQVRFLCVSSLAEQDELALASRDAQGGWKEHCRLKLRSSFISDWLPAASGPLDLVAGSGEARVSKCHFDYPEGARKLLVVLLPNAQKQIYQCDAIDPSKLQFGRGTTLVVNYSKLPGVVMLGTERKDVAPGGRAVARPVAEANGMFRMLVGWVDQEKKIVPCYDRYIPYNRESRDFLLLFPDADQGMRVYNLSEFGPFE